MNKKLLALGAGLTLVATLAVATPAGAADAGPADVTPASLASVAHCRWNTPEYPHISTYALRSGKLEIKTSTQGYCDPFDESLEVTAQMTLERESYLFFWSTVAPAGPAITKNIMGTTRSWQRNELVAAVPCEPGTYRGVLNVWATAADGTVFALGSEIVGPAKPIDCKPRRVSMVIDDTGSMGGIIGSVRSSLGSYIDSMPEDEYTRWSLTTFKDSPTLVGTTEDRTQALSWVNGLSAAGGNDCPEDALGGISNGLAALGTDPDTDKQMIVATDASAHGGDIDGMIASAQATGVHVNVLLAGDCGYASAAATTATATATTMATATAYPYEVSSQVALKRIADETGGKYFFIPGGSTADFTAALNAIFASIANPTADTVPPTVTLSGVPSTLWSPNHKMVEVTPTVTATDNVDSNPAVKLVGVEVSQPDDGQGDGNTTGDVEITKDGRIFVRAERSATDGERVYTITYSATDASGNTGYGSATVIVPKDNSGR